MKVVIKRAGRYNDALNKAGFYSAGSELETKGWYGQELVKAGFAVHPGEVVPTPEVEEVLQPVEESPQPVEVSATNSARILAEQNGIDLSTVTGTGANGKVTVGDVQALING